MNETGGKQVVLREFARYMAGRYRLGYNYLALYWAAVLFEGIIWQKSGLQQGLRADRYPKGKEPNLYALIQGLTEVQLCDDSIWRHRQVFQRFIYRKANRPCTAEIKTVRDVRARLDNFRFLRNRIMHDLSINVLEEEFMPHNCDEFICYVWSELAPESFAKALKNWCPQDGGRPLQALSQISADYMVRVVDETRIKVSAAEFNGIHARDFDNLFHLRDTLLALQAQLEHWLPKHAGHLATDILTTIDTTSAYIWMPLVQKVKKVDGVGKGVWDCSVSILATPLDFRIYMDFGGRARDEREGFYNFLASEDYAEIYERSMAGNGWQVFDVDWYSALHNQRSLDRWVGNRHSDIAAALRILPPRDNHDPDPITWNRMLHGFILSKHDLSAGQAISFEAITEKLTQVIAFHQTFIHHFGQITLRRAP